jgi:hypothetical protein
MVGNKRATEDYNGRNETEAISGKADSDEGNEKTRKQSVRMWKMNDKRQKGNNVLHYEPV